jgi:hypothetical protein
MLQLVIWLGCVYLVFKGKEIEHIAAASSHESRDDNLAKAKVWTRMAYVAAVIFFLLSLAQGSSVPDVPRF